MIGNSELILNDDGSIYHLGLLPGEIASTIITVGDPNRVSQVVKYFDRVEVQRDKREFVTRTGYIGKKRLTVVSTGIGTDNIDIVFQELDALVNIDLTTREIKEEHTPLKFIRLGTSGGIHPDIEVDSIVSSEYSIGLDNLMHHYKQTTNDQQLAQLASAIAHSQGYTSNLYAYQSDNFINLPSTIQQGITVTCPGFYGPQNRALRLEKVWNEDLWKAWQTLEYHGLPVTNYEMETAGILGLASELGHKAMSISAILAHRVHKTFSATPKRTVEHMIKLLLERLSG